MYTPLSQTKYAFVENENVIFVEKPNIVIGKSFTHAH